MKKWNLFKKPEKEPVVNETEVAMQDSSEYRKRGQAILTELQMVRFPATEERREKFDAEKLKKMEQVIETCKSILSNPLPSDLDTSSIDDNIVNLVIQFRTAISDADEGAAYAICKYIGKGVMEFRREFERINEESIENELKSRALRTRQMVVLAGFHNQLTSLRSTIEELDMQIERRKPEYAKVYQDVQDMKKKFPELEMAVEEGLINKTKLSGLSVEYNNLKARAVAIYRDIENLTSLRSEKDAAMQKIEAAIQKGELVLLDASGQLDPSLIREIESIGDSVQEQLAENQALMEDLQKALDKFQAMLDNFFSSTERMNRMIRNEMEFAEMERQKRKIEEIRKEGKRRQLEEEEALKEPLENPEDVTLEPEETEEDSPFIEI